MKLIVGLGNPGSNYDGTRHNVGFEVLGELALRWHTERPKKRFEANLVEANQNGEKVLLAAPQTFMNVSGRSVQQIIKFYQLALPEILVVCDDLNLKVGQLRMRATGSAGGQKGLLSILQVCQSEAVPRLRIGVGRPPEKMDAAAYVLGRFQKDELPTIDSAIRKAAESVELWIKSGIDLAMNAVNAASGNEDRTG